MQIRTRLTLQFTLLVSIVLLSFTMGVYFFAANYRTDEFTSRLKDRALSCVKLLTDVEQIDNKLLKIIEQEEISGLPEEKVLIYDFNDKLIFSSEPEDKDIISHDILKKIKRKGEVSYMDGDREAVGITFTGKYTKYIAVASAYDKYGVSKLNYLEYLLLFGVIVSIAATIGLGLFFSKQALHPISEVVKRVDNISITNLDLRVNEGNGTDEIAQLAIKFNKMLERLQAAFEMQRSFVANASHELRTPLTALTGELEVALMNKEQKPETREVLASLLNDIKQLNRLSNGLLDLAQADLDISELSLVNLRIDEVIGQVHAELLKRNKDYRVIIDFTEFPEDENWLIINANEQLLKSSFLNIIENACKYSPDNTAQVRLDFDAEKVSITVSDKGIGISEEDMQHIYEPFYRASNAKTFTGHGIGLTLTRKIIQLHKGRISLNSAINRGTTVTLVIPHIKSNPILINA